jgi:hypothetical protein
MPLDRLATELEETARQTAEMVSGITEALAALSDDTMSPEAAKAEAILRIVIALQGQDRIEQRCRNIAHAVRQFAHVPHDAPEAAFDDIWASLSLDELRLVSMSGIAATEIHGEVELF